MPGQSRRSKSITTGSRKTAVPLQPLEVVAAPAEQEKQVSPRSRKARLVSEEKSQRIALALDEMAKNPKMITLLDMVKTVEPGLRKALKAGYSHEDLCGMMAECDIQMKPATLKYYLGLAKKGAKTTTKATAKPASR